MWTWFFVSTYVSLFLISYVISPVYSQSFEIGSYILTQKALDDAPDRYNKWIDYFEDKVNEYQYDDIIRKNIDDNDCDGIFVNLYLSKLINDNIYVDRDSLSVQITDSGFLYNAIVYFSGAAPFYLYGEYGWDLKLFKLCFDIDGCGSNKYMTLSGSMRITINTIISIDDTTNTVIMTPEVTVTVNDFIHKLPHCKDVFLWFDLDTIEYLFIKFEGPIKDQVQESIDEMLTEHNDQLTAPQSFIPYEGVKISYQVSDIQFASGIYAKFSAIGSLSALLNDGITWITFDNILSYDNITKPSTDWDLQPAISNINCSDAVNKCGVHLLNGLRLSATVFSAIMWAANQVGNLNPSYSFDVLDATLNFNASWDVPYVTIPEDNAAEVVLPFGNINSSCFDTENYHILNNDNNLTNNVGLETILDFSFYNLSGAVDIDITENAEILIQILSFDITGLNLILNAPPIPLPSNILQAILQQMMNESISYINEWLIENPYQLTIHIIVTRMLF